MMAPIDVQFAGNSFGELSRAAKELQRRINHFPQVSQSFIAQELNYPTLNIKVDRVRSARLGVAQQEET